MSPTSSGILSTMSPELLPADVVAANVMDIESIAERLDVGVESVRVYHQQSARNRREGTPSPRDMPPPTGIAGRAPWWATAVIEDWIPNRPGRGAGGGRRNSELKSLASG